MGETGVCGVVRIVDNALITCQAADNNHDVRFGGGKITSYQILETSSQHHGNVIRFVVFSR